MEKEWKELAQCDKYECSTQGEIRNKKSKVVLKGTVNNRGYVRYDLCLNGKRFIVSGHRAVAETFIPNIDNKPYVNHIDGNKANNSLENLEWCTAKENTHHAINVLKKLQGGKNKKRIKCLNTGVIYSSSCEAESILHISNSAINRVCHNKRKTIRGLRFVFYDGM